MKKILLLGLFFLVRSSCPKIECGNYASHLCAIFEESSISISPCLGSDFCDISNLYTNYESGKTGLECTKAEVSPSSDSIFDLMSLICEESPDLGKKNVGNNPKKCDSNNDCPLVDGSFGQCKCGLSTNGFGYCEISEGDDENLNLVKAACNKRVDEFVAALLQKEFYVFLQDRPLCSGFVFEDIAALDYLNAGGSLNDTVSHFSLGYALAVTFFTAYTL